MHNKIIGYENRRMGIAVLLFSYAEMVFYPESGRHFFSLNDKIALYRETFAVYNEYNF